MSFDSNQVAAIILAAGSGKRFGAAKQFLELDGRPLYLHSVQTFAAIVEIDSIALVTSAEMVEQVERDLDAFALSERVDVVIGGAERQDSVLEGLHHLDFESTRYVLVHDAARALVSARLIQNTISAVRQFGAAIAVLPVVDSIKRVDAGRVEASIDRVGLWRAQTPQAAEYDLLLRALEEARLTGFAATDESAALERIGIMPAIVEGEETNFKITYQGDLDRARAILSHRTETTSSRER